MAVQNKNRRLGSSSVATRGIFIALIAVCLALVPRAGAITFDGATSGIFVDPTGPSGMVTSGAGSNQLQWGVGYQSRPSALTFSGIDFAGVGTDQFFNLGTLSFYNGTLLAGTEAYSADLRAILGFTSPNGFTKNFDFDFQLLNTPNTGTAAQNADSVFFTSFLPTTTFSLDGTAYTLQMGFGSITGKGSGFSQIEKFSVLEGAMATTNLVGKITAATPVPDTGSTLALMAMAIVGLGCLAQYLASKQFADYPEGRRSGRLSD